jgi:COMPASS component SWD3
VVSGSEDHKIYLWDVQSREVVQVLEGHTGMHGSLIILSDAETDHCQDYVLAIATHPTKSIIASGAIHSDLGIRLWFDESIPALKLNGTGT